MRGTGGGPPPTPPKVTEETAIASSMMEVDLTMGDNAVDIFNIEALSDADGTTSSHLSLCIGICLKGNKPENL